MLERKHAACFLAAWVDACSLWRLYMPHLTLPRSSFYCFSRNVDFKLVTGHDIAVVQRCCTQQQFEFLKTAQGVGMRVIYDLDDDVFDIPEFNPAAKVLHQYKDGFAACMRMVDVVTVSTATLAKVVRKNVKFLVNMYTRKEIPILVVENRINEAMFAPPIKSEIVTIGWAGSSSHVGDLGVIEEPLRKISEEFPDVDIEFRGCDLGPESSFTKLPRWRFQYWTPVAEYGARMPRWGWHIAMAPVVDHTFNESKSCIKMIEAAYCRIPCLASYIRPYDEFVSKDRTGELKWLLCSGSSAWYTKLRALLNEPAMREHYGNKMHEIMQKHYSLLRPHEGWDEAIRLAKSA